ncbi:MAG: carbamoyltransferase HypF, partial [Polyangiaceae bacterium]|nr:carbamoyltransferase HypF [Polyangiaceae bacterium]
PRTSSAGRLFDAASALLGLGATASFEGQAAMRLEFAVAPGVEAAYPMELGLEPDGRVVLDWRPLVRTLLEERRAGVPIGALAARFHGGLAEGIARAAERVGEPRVLLTGGCFQNVVLLERTLAALRAHGLRPYHHARIPPNDGGIALGQLAAVAAALRAQPSWR